MIKLALLHKLLLLLLLEVGATGCRVADAVIEATAKSAELTPELIPYWLTTDCSYREYMLMYVTSSPSEFCSELASESLGVSGYTVVIDVDGAGGVTELIMAN